MRPLIQNKLFETEIAFLIANYFPLQLMFSWIPYFSVIRTSILGYFFFTFIIYPALDFDITFLTKFLLALLVYQKQ